MTLAMPPEWAPHERCVVAWPCRADMWGGQLDAAKAAHAAVVNAIVAFEPVTMIADPDDATAARGGLPGRRGGRVADRRLVDPRQRADRACSATTAPGRRRLRFNGWGEKFQPYDSDDALAARCASTSASRASTRAPFVLEGGADRRRRRGHARHHRAVPAATRTATRGSTRAEIEAGLRHCLGVERVIWLPTASPTTTTPTATSTTSPPSSAPGVVLLQGCDDPADPDHDRLRRQPPLPGRGPMPRTALEVVEVPCCRSSPTAGAPRAVPYLNAYVANGVVVVPVSRRTAADDADARRDRRLLSRPRGGRRARRRARLRRRRGALHHPAGARRGIAHRADVR